ncbi:MAG: hypothetical protein LBE12_02565 [Planctomycetaceae bacterium]|jgi:hypothetical protein|nr:hypothetical protein [Planctomycetaceae bacterium]
MEARFFSYILQSGYVIIRMLVFLFLTTGAQYETTNFTVDNAPTPKLAQEFCETAEQYRSELSVLWLGEVLPDWSSKCTITVHVGNHLGAGGATSFVFDNGEVYGWEMEIQGSAQRILDSVLPHEITHTILATHFRKPLPRWLDEGAATSVEHHTEKENYRRMLLTFLSEEVRKGLPFKRMVALKEYPSDPMPFYAQGFSVVEYLLLLGRKMDSSEHHRLLRFAKTGMDSNNWQDALQKHYNIDSLGTLQLNWVQWVNAGFTIEKNLPFIAEINEKESKNLPENNLSVNQSIMLVSAKPASIQQKYGKSIYEKTVEKAVEKTIEKTPEKTAEKTIEKTVEKTAENQNQHINFDPNEPIRLDAVIRSVRR